MQATSKAQRKKARRKPVGSPVVHISSTGSMHDPRWVAASLVDIIDTGCGLALTAPLQPGSTVVVRGGLGPAAGQGIAGVRWCVARTDGTYRAGLEFLGHSAVSQNDDDQQTLDCYRVLQLSPHADRSMISRAYRKLALRYHPDNAETGNSEMFLRLSRAYQILIDPEKRARYDRTHRGEHAPAPAAPAWNGFRPSAGTLRGWDAALQRA